ncbi:hypothetical protein lb338_phage_131 [Lactobacillus phage Lb338-1]|uniref:Baseplate protein J-like barrel domain-containing protein n=1 Tax=Lactobacillus phage Lb338-1 TaxID=2892342 RepID=C1KFP1_9CAUD|nr:baseplate J-like protein [Lactobacillus phage Lb338-1]ACO37052.1 hypothetical protein lb338_phage_131 [Lactobacillus phage Lb338-1]
MQIKRLSDILASLIDNTTARTTLINDFTPGSVIRSIYEAVAMQLEEYYYLQEENISWGIQNGVLSSFGFSPREATPAYGDIDITFYGPLSQDTTIPRGTTFYSSNDLYSQTYVLQEPYLVRAGSIKATVTAYCTQVGSAGNIPAAVLDSCSGMQTGIYKVTNTDAILTGTDEESVDEERLRFNEFVDTRGRGTVKAMDYAARTIPEVTGVYIDETVGHVTVYAHDANGDLSDALINEIATAEEDYRPVAIPWDVQPVSKNLLDIEVSVTVTNYRMVPSDFTDNLSNYIGSYLDNFSAGDDLIISALESRIRAFSPLIYDVSVTNPSGNVAVAPNEIIRAGTASIIISNEVG